MATAISISAELDDGVALVEAKPESLPRNGNASQDIDSDNLNDVVAGCQRNDAAAQRQLYDSCHHFVYRLATRMVGREDAVDVTQQVFLQVFRSIDQFNWRSRFETWLYRLSVNESLQHLRRARRHKLQRLTREPAVWDRKENRFEQRDLLEHALAQIDPELRAIFLLREIDGLSYSEIADVVEIPEGTVGSRLNRARRELRNCITAQKTGDRATEHDVFLRGDHENLCW